MDRPHSVKSMRDWSLGLFFLACVVILWVLSSFLLNAIFVNDSSSYLKPFFITWINTASFALYLIPYYLDQRREQQKLAKAGGEIEDEIPVSSYEHDDLITEEESTKAAKLSVNQTIQLAFWFCLLWFLSNFLNNASLIFTSVSSQTILSSSSSLFTILVGYIFKVEKINYIKLISIGLSFIGVLLVTNNDDPTSSSTTSDTIWLGNLLALLGALCYGIYSILLKLRVQDDSRMDMRLFFGFVGVFNTVLLWPLILILNFTNLEKFELPETKQIYLVIFINCMMSFLADYLWARSTLLTTPLTVTVGLSLTIPVAMVLEFVIKRQVNSFAYIFGAFLICLSFYYINKSEQDEEARP